jgi:hypothetical protein
MYRIYLKIKGAHLSYCRIILPFSSIDPAARKGNVARPSVPGIMCPPDE